MTFGVLRALATALAAPASAPQQPDDRPVVLVCPPERTVDQGLALASAIAEVASAPLVVLRPMILPRQTPLDPDSDEVAPHRNAVETVVDAASKQGLQAEGVVRLGHHLAQTIAEAAREHEAHVVLVPGRPPVGSMGGFSRGQTDQLMAQTEAPVVVYGEPPTAVEPEQLKVAVASGPHTEAMLAWASWLSVAWSVPVELFHVLDPDAGAEEREVAQERLAEHIDELDPGVDAGWRLVEAGELTSAVLDVCDTRDALVLGAPTRSRWRHLFFGSRAREAQRTSPGWSFVVHAP